MLTKVNLNKIIKVIVLNVLLLTFSVVFVRVLIQLKTTQPYKKYLSVLKEGQIADSDVIVNFTADIIDVDATNKLRNENEKKILPYFSYSVSTSLGILSSFDRFRTYIRDKNYSAASDVVEGTIPEENISHYSNLVLSFSSEIISSAYSKGIFNSKELEVLADQDFDSISLSSSFLIDTNSGERVLSLNDFFLTENTIDTFILEKMNNYSGILSVTETYQVREIVRAFIRQNVFFDSFITTERKTAAYEETKPVIHHFERGDKIILRNRIITTEQLDILRLLSTQTVVSTEDIITTVIICLFVFSLLYYEFSVLGEYGNRSYKRLFQYYWIMTVGISLTCFIAYFPLRFINYDYVNFDLCLLPITFMPVLITMMLSKKSLGVITSVITSFSLVLISNSDFLGLLYSLVAGISSVFLVVSLSKRTAMLLQWIVTTVAVSAETILFMFLGAYSFDNLYFVLLGSFGNIMITMLLISVLLPLLESIFNIATVYRLYELSMTDNKLLNRLKSVASGTYSHSIMVSELAYQAAKDIGANAMLAKVGALYHDIGKIEHPDYFIENQQGQNKHDDINPQLSATIIRNHVKSGAEMGREEGLPVEIIDIIANHHGTGLIRFFFSEAKKEESSINGTVAESDYRYNAEIPDSKECAIVLLADSVEAATRAMTISSSEPNISLSKYAKKISEIISYAYNDKQLDNSGLTINDLSVISKSFLGTLKSQHHNRIEYNRD